MHDGFKVLRFGQNLTDDGEHEVLARNNQHGSLAYGVDWAYTDSTPQGKTTIASCSFYDHALQLWSA